jgi:NarL family two-component system response regulator LiaR
VLALSELRDKHDLMYCYLAGVDSFVSTHEHPDRLLSAVRSTLGGRREWILGASGGHTRDDTGSTAGLTPREVEVLWMVRGRCTNGQIGTALHISPNTVKNHVAAILRKLGARRRSDLFSGYVQVS